MKQWLSVVGISAFCGPWLFSPRTICLAIKLHGLPHEISYCVMREIIISLRNELHFQNNMFPLASWNLFGKLREEELKQALPFLADVSFHALCLGRKRTDWGQNSYNFLTDVRTIFFFLSLFNHCMGSMLLFSYKYFRNKRTNFISVLTLRKLKVHENIQTLPHLTIFTSPKQRLVLSISQNKFLVADAIGWKKRAKQNRK